MLTKKHHCCGMSLYRVLLHLLLLRHVSGVSPIYLFTGPNFVLFNTLGEFLIVLETALTTLWCVLRPSWVQKCL